MCCLVALVGLITPRVVMVVLWVFTNYLNRAFGSFFWPFLGFLFLPTTTLAYAIAQNAFNGLKGAGLLIFVLGILIDFGVIGSGRGARLGRRRGYEEPI
jgi:hypothetical protein